MPAPNKNQPLEAAGSNKTISFSHYTLNTPALLQNAPQWILFRKAYNEKRKKWDKFPTSPFTGHNCDVKDNTQWMSQTDAFEAWSNRFPHLDGLGFVLAGGIVAVDLDQSLNEQGEPLEWVKPILALMPDSFTEISLSGRGLHVFFKGELGDRRNRWKLPDGPGIEVYDRERFIAFTANRFRNSPLKLDDGAEALDRFYAEFGPKDKATKPTTTLMPDSPQSTLNVIPDAELVEKMFSSQHGDKIRALWNGDTSGHGGDDSAADLALMNSLAWWTNKDSHRMKALFSQSSLAQREKWQREDYQQMTIAKALEGTTGGYTGAAAYATQAELLDAPWPDPLPFQSALLQVEPFNPLLLPDEARPWIEDAAYRMQAPMDLMGATMLIVLGTVIGRQVAIRPKALDSWTVVCNVWGACVGRPSIMKSPAIKEVLDALTRLGSKENGQFKAKLAEYEALQKVAKLKQDILAKAMKTKAAIRLKANPDDDLADLVLACQEDADASKPPTCKRYMSSDGTIEKLGELLQENPTGLLVFRDELMGFLSKLGKDGREGDRAFFLEAWNGNSPFTFDRIIRGTTHIDGLCLSLYGGIQPGPFMTLIRQALRQTAQDDGFLQRFQVLVWPDTPDHFTNIDQLPDNAAKQQFYNLVERLGHIDLAAIGATCGEFDGLPYLRFSQEAQPVFNGWHQDWRNDLYQQGENPALEAHFAKFPSLIPSIALIVHLANGDTGPVSKAALLRALAWCDYLISHARRAYIGAKSCHMEGAQTILNGIRHGDLVAPFSARTVYRKHWEGLDQAGTQEALEELEERHYIRRHVEQTGGKPKTLYHVNPHWLEQVNP